MKGDPAGDSGGGHAQVETRRGSAGLHGQGFLTDRQNLWGAQNPFTQWVKESAPATLVTTPGFSAYPYSAPDRDDTWGIGLGSAIRRQTSVLVCGAGRQ